MERAEKALANSNVAIESLHPFLQLGTKPQQTVPLELFGPSLTFVLIFVF